MKDLQNVSAKNCGHTETKTQMNREPSAILSGSEGSRRDSSALPQNGKKNLFVSIIKHKYLAFAGVFVFLFAGFFAISSLNARPAQAGASTIVTGNNAFGTPYSGGRHVVETTNGAGANRTFVVAWTGTALNLYYSDNPDASTPSWTNVGTLTSTTGNYTNDMVWDSSNNVLYIAYGLDAAADSAQSDVFYRRVTAISSTPVLGTERVSLNASASINYTHPHIAIAQDSGTTKVFVVAVEHPNCSACGASKLALETGTINSDNPTWDTIYYVKTWTQATNSDVIGITRVNTSKLAVFYYDGVNMLATRHDDASDAQLTSGWDALNGTDNSQTTISADDPGARGTGSVTATTSSDVIWFGWLDAAVDVNTVRWSGTALDTEMVPIAGTDTKAGPSLGTDGTTVWMTYLNGTDSTIIQYQTRSFTDGTTAWSGSATTIADVANAIWYPGMENNVVGSVPRFVYTESGTANVNYYAVIAPITISGTCDGYDQTTDCVDGVGTVKVAVNGVVDAGSDATFTSGAWSFSMAKPTSGDSIIVFLDGAADADEATAVTLYDGSGNIDNVVLYKQQVTIGSNGGSNPSQNISRLNMDDYDATNDEDIFYDYQGVSTTCNNVASFTGICIDGNGTTGSSSQEKLHIISGNTFSSSVDVLTHDVVIDSTATYNGSSNTHTVSGSWANSGTFSPGSSLVKFTSTSSGETITGGSSAFNDITFNGVGGEWTLQDSVTISSVLTITNGNFNAGSGTTLTLSGTGGNPLQNSATFTAGTSTVSYTGANAGGNVTVENTTFYNLTLDAGDTFVLSGATVVTHDLNITSSDILDTVTGQNYNLTIGRNFTNAGTFTARNGTVYFDTTATSVITGATSFYGFNVSGIGAAKTIQFQAGVVFSFTGPANSVVVTGTSGNLVTITSTTTAVWLADFSNTQNTLTYVFLQHSGCSTSAIVSMDGTSTNDATSTINDSTCWDFPTIISVSGTVYTDEGSTAMTTQRTVRIKVNGLGSYSQTAAANGTYTVSSVAADTGSILTIYLDDATENANTITTSSGSNLSNIPLYQNRVIIRDENAAGFTNDHLDVYDSDDEADGDLMFTATPGLQTALVVADGAKLYVSSSVSYTPNGDITTSPSSSSSSTDGDVYIGSGATVDLGGTYGLSIGGDFNNAGTFTGTDVTIFTATASGHTIAAGGSSFNSVQFNGVGGAWAFTDTNVTTDSDFEIINGSVTAPSGTLSIIGSYNNSGTFLNNSGSVDITPSGGASMSGTLSGATGKFYNLNIGNGSSFSIGSNLEVVQDLIISNGGSVTFPAQVTIGRNFGVTDPGTTDTTTNSTTITFNTSAISTISGTGGLTGPIFYNLTVATPGKTVKFTAGETVKINGALTVTGGAGNNVIFTSSTGSSIWTINHQGTESITYLTVNWGACYVGSPSSTTITMGTGSTKDINSGSCWSVPASAINITGFLYLSDATTVDGTVRTLKWSKAGAASSTVSTTVTTGAYTINTVAVAGDIFTIWIDGGSLFGTTILRYGTNCVSTPDCSGIKVVRNQLRLYSKNATTLTYDEIDDCDADVGAGCATSNIGYNVNNSTHAITLNDGMSLYVTGGFDGGGATFAPGAALTTSPSADGTDSNVDGDVSVSSEEGGGGTLNMGSNALSIGGDFSNVGSLTLSSGQTTTFTATATGHSINPCYSAFENVILNGSGGGWEMAHNCSGTDITINGDLTVTAGTLSNAVSGHNLTVSGGDVTGDGDINLTGGTLTVSGTGSFGGATAWDLYDLTLSGASSNTTFTGDGQKIISHVFTIGANHTLLDNTYSLVRLTGSGTPLVSTGAFSISNLAFSYEGTSATNVAGSSNGGSSITYKDLYIGGAAGATFTLGTASSQTINTNSLFTTTSNSSSIIVTGATYNPTINTGLVTGGITICDTCEYRTGTGTLTMNSAQIYRLGTFTATTGNTVLYNNASGHALHNGAMTGSNAYYNLSITGAGTFYSSLGDTEVNNDFTISNGILDDPGFYGMTVHGAVTGDGTISFGGTFTQNTTSSKNFGGNTAWTFGPMNFTGSGTSTATGSGSITTTGGVYNDVGHTLNAGSKTWIFTGGSNSGLQNASTFNAGTSIFSYRYSSVAVDLPGDTYYDLELAPVSGTATFNSMPNLTVAHNLTLAGAGAAVLDIGPNDGSLDVNGDVVIGSGDTLSNGPSYLTVGGSWTNNGTFSNPQSTALIFDSTATGKTITAGSGTYFDVFFDGIGGGWTLQDNITASGELNITNGNLNASSRTITLSGTGTPFVKGAGGTFTQGTSTVHYAGQGSSTVTALNGSSTTNAYYNLKVGYTSATPPGEGGPPSYGYFLNGDTTVNNVLQISDATNIYADTLTVSNSTLTLKGPGTPLVTYAGTGIFDPDILGTPCTVVYTSASGVTALSSLAVTYGDLTINGSGTFNATSNINALDLTVTSGTLSSAYNISATGNVTGNGTITHTANTFTLNAAGSSNFGGDTDWSFNNMLLTSGTVTATGSGAVNVAGTLTLDNTVTLAAGSKTWNLSGTGTPFVKTGTFTPNTSTVNYTGAGATNVAAASYNNLGVKPGANATTFTLGTAGLQTITVGGTLTIGDGSHTTAVVTANTWNPIIDVNGTGTAVDIKANTTFTAPASASFTVAGSWANAGTFTNNSGTVTFDATGTGKTIASNGSSWNNVVFNGSGGGWSPSDAMSVAGDLTITLGTLSGTQNVTVNGGDLTGNGTISMSNGFVRLNGNGSFGGDTTWTFKDLSFGSGATETSVSTGTGGINVTGSLTVNAGQTLNAGSKTWVLSGTGTAFTKNGTFTPSASTVQYTGATANITASTYNNLTLGAGFSSTYTMPASNTTFNGNLVVSNNATVTKGAGTLIFAGGVYQTITDSNSTKQDLGALKSSSGSGSTANVASQANGGIAVASSTISASFPSTAVNDGYRYSGGSNSAWGSGGGWNDDTANTYPDTLDITFNNSYSISEIDVITLPDGIDIGANPTLSDTFSTYGITAFAIKYWDGGAWQTINSVTGNNKVWRQFTFSAVTTNKIRLEITNGNQYSRVLEFEAWSTDSSGLNLASDVKATSLTVDSSHGFNLGTSALTLTGNGASVLVNNGTFNAASGTVNFDSALTTGTTIPALTYYNLGMNKASNTFTAGGNITAHNVTISAGTFTAPSGTLTINGDLTNNDTFTHNSGTVVLAPTDASKTANVNGSANITFNNLTNVTNGTTVMFKNGRTYTIGGVLTAGGSSGAPVNLFSDSSGSTWTVSFSAQPSLTLVAVRDGACSGGLTINPVETLINLGNNGLCWAFIRRGGGTGNSDQVGQGSGGSSGGGGSQGGGSVQAVATATVNAGAVTGFSIVTQGNGYTTAPAVCMTGGGGTGATATATISGGHISAINVVSGGSGYSIAPTVTITAPPGTGGSCGSSGGGGGAGGGGGGGAP